jgi:hypothetical protein
MPTTLTDGVTTANLSDDMEWVDEFSWAPVAQERYRTLTGAQWLFEAELVEGRPITLVASDDRGWISRADVEALLLMASGANSDLTLSLRGNDYTVAFDRSQGAIGARAVLPLADVDPDDAWIVTVRLITV